MKQPKWEVLAREYIALDDPTFLERAIEAASGKEVQIQRLLGMIQHGKLEDGEEQDEFIAATSFIEELRRGGRRGEAWTLALLMGFLVMRPLQFQKRWSPGEHVHWLQALKENADKMVGFCLALHDEPCRARFLFYRATAILLSLQGSTPDAIKDMEEAAEIYRSLAERFPTYRELLANVLNNLGSAYSEQGHHEMVERGVTILEEAVDIWRTLASEDPGHRLGFIGALNNLGLAYIDLNFAGAPVDPTQISEDFDRFIIKTNPRVARLQAFGLLGEALNLTQERIEEQPEEARAERIEILVNMGAIARLEGDRSTALKFNDEALQLYRSGQDDEGAHHDRRVGLYVLRMRGTLLREMGDVDEEKLCESYTVFKEAAGLFEGYLGELPWQDDQLRFLGREGNIYQQIVTTCLLAAEASESDESRREWHHTAWKYAERSRALLTRQTLIQAAGDAPGATSPPTQAFEDLAALSTRFRDPAFREDDRQAILDKIARAHPNLKAITEIKDSDLDAIQRQLREIPDGSLLVEFSPWLALSSSFSSTARNCVSNRQRSPRMISGLLHTRSAAPSPPAWIE